MWVALVRRTRPGLGDRWFANTWGVCVSGTHEGASPPTTGWAEQALEALAMPTFALDREYRCTAFNAAFSDAFRDSYRVEIALGANLLERITVDEDRAAAKANFDRVLAGEQVASTVAYGEESRSRRRYSVIRSPIRKDGKIIGLAAVVVDETEHQRAVEEVVGSKRFVQNILDSSPNLIYIHDLVGNRNVYVNREASEFLGYAPEQIGTFGSEFLSKTLHPEDAERVAAHHAGFAFATDDKAFEIEYRMKHVGGEWRWLRSREVVFARDGEGVATQILGFTEDVTESKAAEEDLRASEERYRALVEAVRDIVFVIGRDDRIQYVNEVAAGWLQRPRKDIIGMKRIDVFPADEEWSRSQPEALRRVAETGESLYVEHPAYFPGGVRWQATSLAPLRDAKGSISGVLGIGRDITDHRNAEQARVGKLEHLAHADVLTGLLNRRGFELLSKQAVAQAQRSGEGVGVIYADMDGLKAINDELGHAAGDQVLRDAAAVLCVTLRSVDVISRVGGDEFIVFAVGEDEGSIHLLAERVQEGIDAFNSTHPESRPMSMSCGVSWRGPGVRFDLDQLVGEADAAMYREKARRFGDSAR